jgi:hypothetical protein
MLGVVLTPLLVPPIKPSLPPFTFLAPNVVAAATSAWVCILLAALLLLLLLLLLLWSLLLILVLLLMLLVGGFVGRSKWLLLQRFAPFSLPISLGSNWF